jgi:hypothetical protein
MSSSNRSLEAAARAFEANLNAKALCPSCGEGRLLAMDIGGGARGTDRHVFCDLCGARSVVDVRDAAGAEASRPAEREPVRRPVARSVTEPEPQPEPRPAPQLPPHPVARSATEREPQPE